MTQLLYASTPLPTTGESRSTAEQSLAAIFLAIQTAHNATDTIVAAAASAATAGTLVLRDGSGGATFAGTLTAAAVSASGNVGVAGTLNVTGAAGVAGALGVTGALTGSTGGFSGAVTAPAFHGPADALAAPLPFTSTIADFKATPGAAGQIAIAAGAGYEDSNGAYVPASGAATVAAQTVTLPAQPSGTNVQYVAITLAPTNGSATTTTAATLSALNATPIPTANRPVCVIVQRGATTNPTNVTAAADILEMRGGAGGGAGGGGGGGAGATTAFVPTIGAPASSGAASGVNLDSILRGTASGTVNGFDTSTYRADPLIVKSAGAGQAGFDTIRDWYVQPDMGGRIQAFSSNQVQIIASASSPVTLGHAGLLKTNTGNVFNAVGATGAAGVRTIVGDVGTSGTAGWTVALLTPGTAPTATQTALGLAYWDGGTLHTDILDLSGLASVASQQVALTKVKAALTSSVSGFTTTPFAIPTGMQQTTFYTTTAMQGLVILRAAGSLGTGTTGDVIFRAQIVNTTNGTFQSAEDVIFQTAASQGYRAKGTEMDTTTIIYPGVNTLSMVVQADSPSQVNINAATVLLVLFHL